MQIFDVHSSVFPGEQYRVSDRIVAFYPDIVQCPGIYVTRVPVETFPDIGGTADISFNVASPVNIQQAVDSCFRTLYICRMAQLYIIGIAGYNNISGYSTAFTNFRIRSGLVGVYVDPGRIF